MSMPPRRDPAVLPMGRKGTAGKTASIQNMAKAIEPSTTAGTEASAIFLDVAAAKESPMKNGQDEVSAVQVCFAAFS